MIFSRGHMRVQLMDTKINVLKAKNCGKSCFTLEPLHANAYTTWQPKMLYYVTYSTKVDTVNISVAVVRMKNILVFFLQEGKVIIKGLLFVRNQLPPSSKQVWLHGNRFQGFPKQHQWQTNHLLLYTLRKYPLLYMLINWPVLWSAVLKLI